MANLFIRRKRRRHQMSRKLTYTVQEKGINIMTPIQLLKSTHLETWRSFRVNSSSSEKRLLRVVLQLSKKHSWYREMKQALSPLKDWYVSVVFEYLYSVFWSRLLDSATVSSRFSRSLSGYHCLMSHVARSHVTSISDISERNFWLEHPRVFQSQKDWAEVLCFTSLLM